MKDKNKTKAQLIAELDESRERISALNLSEAERFRVEEALRESEEKYRSLVERANDGIAIIQNGLVKFVNPRLAQMRGESEEEIIGQRITKYICSDKQSQVLAIYRKQVAGDDIPSIYETILQHVDGSQVIAEISSGVINYEGKSAILIVVRDVTERKRAEQTLKESLERLKGFDLHSTEGIYRVDLTKPVPIDLPRAEIADRVHKYGVVGEVNDSLAKMYGLKPQDMIGRPAVDFAPNYGERALLILDEEEYQVKNLETEDKDKDGTPLYLLENYHGIVEDGHLISIWGAQNNITKRVLAETELQRKHNLLTAILEGTPDVVFVKDCKGRYVMSNPARDHLLSLEEAEALGKEDTDFYPTEVARRIIDDDRLVMDSGESLKFEEQIVSADGETRTFLTSKHPWRDGRGQIIGVIGVAHDITERVHAEKALRSAEREKETILDSLVEHVVHQDVELRILWANRAACESVGLTQRELQGRHCYEIWEERSEPCTDCPVLKAMKTKRPREIKKTTQDGRIWLIRGYPEVDEHGNIVGGIEVTLEITERVHAEKALRESEAKMKSIFKASPTGIGLVADRVLLDVNEKICEMLGYSQEELIGKSARVLYPTDEDYEYVGREKYAQIQEFGSGTVETCWKRKDGQIINGLLSSTPLDPTDLSAGVTFTALDITERMQAEVALRESETRYRTLFEHANDAIFLENKDDEIIDVNRQACEMMGYARGELLKMTVSELQAPEVRGEKGTVVVQELNKHSGKLFESLNIHRDGTLIPVEVSTAPMPGKDAGLVLAIVRDITKRKQAQEQIRGYVNGIEALLEIEKAITSTLNLEEVLDTIMTELAKVIPYDSISLQILHDESLEILACRGFDRPDEVIGLVFPLDPKFPNQRVVQEGKALSIEDVTQEYPHFQSESSKYESGHICSWLGVPLISKGTVKGMIALDRSEVIPFSDSEIQLATAVANQAVLAIENARLFSDANRRLERLASLRQIDQAITGSMDLNITLNILIGHILQRLEVDAAAVLLYRVEMQSLEFVAGQGFRTRALQSTNLRLGQGFAGQAAFDQRIVRVSDLEQLQTGFSHSPEFPAEKFKSYYGVPLIAKGNIIGVLEIFHRHPLDPDPEWIDFLETLAGQAAIAINNLQLFGDLQSSNFQLLHAYDATIEGWSRVLELRDPEPREHNQMAADLTLELARRMGIDEKQLIHIRRGALLHDVGKMGVPDAILKKTGKLTTEEWEVIRQHPEYAYKWLAPILYLKPALSIPYCHHEKWDGTGYPQGLKGDQIPLPARIFAVVDVWFALLSDRPYRKAWSQEKALAYVLEQSGKHFDPQVVDVFLEILLDEERFTTS